MNNIIHISYGKVYRVGGVTFEWSQWHGPTIINRHTEKERNFKNISQRNWSMIEKFCSMDLDRRELHRIN